NFAHELIACLAPRQMKSAGPSLSDFDAVISLSSQGARPRCAAHPARPRRRGDRMTRRQFITLLGGATAAAWPLLGTGPPAAGGLAAMGLLGCGAAAALGGWTAAFMKRLGELGWIEGRTVAIEFRWAEGRNERSAEFAAEFVRLNVDAIVTVGTPTTVAATHATSIIPIVFVAAGGPVGPRPVPTSPR